MWADCWWQVFKMGTAVAIGLGVIVFDAEKCDKVRMSVCRYFYLKLYADQLLSIVPTMSWLVSTSPASAPGAGRCGLLESPPSR